MICAVAAPTMTLNESAAPPNVAIVFLSMSSILDQSTPTTPIHRSGMNANIVWQHIQWG